MKSLIAIMIMICSTSAFAFSETSEQAVAAYVNKTFGTALSETSIGVTNQNGEVLYIAEINAGCVLVLEDSLIPSIQGGYAHKVTLVGQRELHINACPK